MAGPALDRFETVAWVYNPSDLALLVSKFVQVDIMVQRASVWHASADPGLMTALGGVEIRVREEDGAAARALLAELEPMPYRVPFFWGLFPVFLVMAFFGVGAPPRQIPAFALGEAAARREA